MTKNSPIGVFDSGLGGISIWRGIHEKLPRESIVYLGDGLRCPYGERPQSEIQQFTFEAVQKLLKEQCKLIVIACNTATAMAIDDVRKRFTDIPIVGLEPAIKPAAIASKSGVVGVVATARSFQGRLYKHTSSLFQDRVRILESVGEGWVELVENNMEDSLEALPLVSRVIEPMIEAGADHIVLGCK
ncbi:MAG: glutamate racemase, partial [Alistipes sp.]|nr:glutamate racemase [Candidatus Alistipes equi]